MPDFAKIRVQLPKGCNRKALSIHSLDRRSRELAYQTFIFVDGKQLLCTSFKLVDLAEGQVLQLTVAPECFEIVETEEPRTPDPNSYEAMETECVELLKRDRVRLPGDRKPIL
jgi:F420-0:gamma-glutamyl ligase